MPIENLSENNQIATQNNVTFAPNSTVIGGFMVKHPLFECKFLLLGFASECPIDSASSKISGMSYYKFNWRPFFPKVVIDMKQNEDHFSEKCCGSRWNYYFYNNITDKFSVFHSDSIFAICKYREDGVIKHEFFNLHEITPVL